MIKEIKKIAKYTLTFPQVMIHRMRGIEGNYGDLVSFFRYFPFGKIEQDHSVSFRSHGHKVKIFYGDLAPLAAGIFKNGEYDLVPVQGKSVVDVGAYIGDTAVYFALRGAQKIYAYELNKRYFEMARKNIDLNNLNNKIELEYCGIASKKIDSRDQMLGASVPTQDQKNIEGASFKTLDAIVLEKKIHDGVLKLDVDGFEYEIIRNSSIATLRQFEIIFMEYHFGVQDIESKLLSAGFSVVAKRITMVTIDHHPEQYRNMDIGYILATRISEKNENE